MKQLLVLLMFCLSSSCNRNTPPLIELPDEIHKRIIFSEPCDLISFSSNQEDYFKPWIIAGTKNKTPVKKSLNFSFATNTYPQSISCDCESLSIIKENVQKRSYQLLIYDLSSQQTKVLADSIDEDGGSSAFSPSKTILGYLNNHKPYLYYVDEHKVVPIKSPENVDFRNLTWSAKGNYLFFEDYAGDIWRFDMKKRILTIFWESPAETMIKDRLITPSFDDEETMYFISDHESAFNQIYKFSGKHGIERYVISKFDKSLFKRPVSENNFYYRFNKDGCYIVQKRVKDSFVNWGPTNGVVYDYVYEKDSTELFLYAQSNLPASIHRRERGQLTSLTSQLSVPNAPVPEIVFNKEGIHHFIFKPEKKNRGWLVWLHGGPFEQVSKRYNSYIASLVNAGWSVIALNYPGSTGIGNGYESKLEPNLLSTQITAIRRDLLVLMAKYKFQRYGIIGISYGSLIANELANHYSNEVLSIIEISGTNAKPYPVNLSTLFVFGEYDYTLQNPDRRRLIERESKNKSVQTLILQNEGHSIARKTNHLLALNKLTGFLNQ